MPLALKKIKQIHLNGKLQNDTHIKMYTYEFMKNAALV